MMRILIEQYINRLEKQDVVSFGEKNGIILNEKELDTVFNHIKNNWKTIIYGNPRPILDDIKAKVEPLSYEKIENLYSRFYEKYKDYL